ncbi:PA3496 family putative envelope integrity protein [Marinobacterium sp. YM272]|uniref:PA3496 family putative envelope integrity protein n=1 Tax=Marinobacterium sp. YM272 TaxID=3421654 RepID=UPI003D7F29CB
MGTKVRVDHSLDDLEDWSEQLSDDEEVAQTRLRYNGKRRRQIEDLMEERALARQISDIYDERV